MPCSGKSFYGSYIQIRTQLQGNQNGRVSSEDSRGHNMSMPWKNSPLEKNTTAEKRWEPGTSRSRPKLYYINISPTDIYMLCNLNLCLILSPKDPWKSMGLLWETFLGIIVPWISRNLPHYFGKHQEILSIKDRNHPTAWETDILFLLRTIFGKSWRRYSRLLDKEVYMKEYCLPHTCYGRWIRISSVYVR